MANSEYAGSQLYAQWIYAGGTVLLNTDNRNFNYTPNLNWIDATAGADVNQRWIKSFTNGQVTCDVLAQFDGDGTAYQTAFAEGTEGTLTWGLAGTASNYPKQYAAFRSGGLVESAPYNDVVTYSITLQQNGARTDTTW